MKSQVICASLALFCILSADSLTSFGQTPAVKADVEFLTALRAINREYWLWLPVSEAGGDVNAAGIAANRHKMQQVAKLLQQSIDKPVDKELIAFSRRMVLHAVKAEESAKKYAKINEEGLKEMMEALQKGGFGTDEALASAIGIGIGTLYQSQKPLAELTQIHKIQVGYFQEWKRLLLKVSNKHRGQSKEIGKLIEKPNATFPLAWITVTKMTWSKNNPGATQKQPIRVASLSEPRGYQIPSKSRSWRYFFRISNTKQRDAIAVRVAENQGDVELLLHDPYYRPLIKQAGTSDAKRISTVRAGKPETNTLKLKRGSYLVEVRHYYKPRFGTRYRESGATIAFWRGDAKAPPKVEVVQELRDTNPLSNQLRTWTDSTGKFTVKATFVRIDGTTVVLRRENNMELRVPIDSLSKSDREVLSRMKK